MKGNKNPKIEFHNWIDHGFTLGYDHLFVKAYSEYYFFQLYNYDIVLCWIVIFYGIYLLMKKIFIVLFCTCKPPKKDKTHQHQD
jgi:hypothetical protein